MLEGIKVIEMATYIAAPGAGGILADWGAEVIKVEPLAGCPMRGFLGSLGVDNLQGNPVFELDNRGKKGVAVNTSTEDGVAIIKKLVADADVFLTNVRPGGLERAGLDYKALSEVNPKLVYCSVSGYGLEGEERDRPGFDQAAFYARSGLARMQTPKGDDPAPLRMAVGDHITSMATVSGILGAIIERGRTGKGKLVEASLLRTGIYALSCDMSIQLMFGKLSSTKSRYESNNPLNNYFRTRDEKWFTIVPRQGPVDWPALCKVIGAPDLENDPRFDSARNRRTNARAFVEVLDSYFTTEDMAHWAERLDAEDLIWAPLMTPAEVAADPQAIATGAFTEVMEHGNSNSTFRSPASPIRFDGTNEPVKQAAPVLGEHTEEVLRACGFDELALERMRANGTLG